MRRFRQRQKYLKFKQMAVLSLILALALLPGDTLGVPIVTVELTAGTGTQGNYVFEHNAPCTFNDSGGLGSASMTYGNLDPQNPSRSVWKAVITRTDSGAAWAGVCLVLGCLDVTPLPDPEELVFDVRWDPETPNFWIKMESQYNTCPGTTCADQILANTIITPSSSYQEVRIPLSIFDGCNVQEERLKAWTIVRNSSSGGSGTLTLYFDNLRFE